MLCGSKPDVINDRRYTVKETSALLGIHRNTLTKYTTQGLIFPIMHKADNRLYYLGKEIIRFWNQTI